MVPLDSVVGVIFATPEPSIVIVFNCPATPFANEYASTLDDVISVWSVVILIAPALAILWVPPI